MKYGLIQKIMWQGYKSTFKKELTTTFHEPNPKEVMKLAHLKYKSILLDINEFDKKDRFLINIVSAAMLASILLSTKNKYSVEEVRIYYRKAMCENILTKLASKKSKAYTKKGREILKKQADESATLANNNPYTWRFTVEDGETLNQYTATFYTCGICHLMKKLNLQEYVPAMCSLDYDMAELNNTEFTRKYTLAENGPYCDCHYNHKGKIK